VVEVEVEVGDEGDINKIETWQPALVVAC